MLFRWINRFLDWIFYSESVEMHNIREPGKDEDRHGR